MNDLRENLWEELCNDLFDTITESIELYQHSIEGYNCKETEIENTIVEIRKEAWAIFMNLIAEETTDNLILVRLREKFEEIFRYDKNGLPRIWGSSDDIDSCFNKAKEEALLLITLYSFIDASEQKIREVTGIDELQKKDLVIIDDIHVKQILSKFIREIELQFIDAKRSIVRTTSKVPTWFIVLTIVLGYNEFVSLIKNPLYLIIGVVLAVTFYVLYSTNLIKPVIRISKVVIDDVWLQINTFFHESAHKMTHNTSSQEYKPVNDSYAQVDKLSHYNDTIPLSTMSRRNKNVRFDSSATLINNNFEDSY